MPSRHSALEALVRNDALLGDATNFYVHLLEHICARLSEHAFDPAGAQSATIDFVEDLLTFVRGRLQRDEAVVGYSEAWVQACLQRWIACGPSAAWQDREQVFVRHEPDGEAPARGPGASASVWAFPREWVQMEFGHRIMNAVGQLQRPEQALFVHWCVWGEPIARLSAERREPARRVREAVEALRARLISLLAEQEMSEEEARIYLEMLGAQQDDEANG